MTEINVPLLRKAVEHIDAHPEEFQMGSWAMDMPKNIAYLRDFELSDDEIAERFHAESVAELGCGTTMCLAGTVAWLEGWDMKFGHDGAATVCTKDGETRSIEVVATKALGIDLQAVDHLFYATWIKSADGLRRQIRNVLNVEL